MTSDDKLDPATEATARKLLAVVDIHSGRNLESIAAILRTFAHEIRELRDEEWKAKALETIGRLQVAEQAAETLAEALVRIAMTCCMNVYAVNKDFWCLPEEGKHSIYCAEGMARKALLGRRTRRPADR